MANAVVLWVIVYFCVTSVNTKDRCMYMVHVCFISVAVTVLGSVGIFVV